MKAQHTNQLYISCVEQTARVLNESGIEKSFNTWLRQDGPAGQELAQVLFDNFWSDSESRMIELRISNPVTLSRATKFYARVYYGSVVSYDESLNPVNSDMILADALWRNLFGTIDTSAITIDKFVEYVRRELTNLDETDDIVMRGVINWGPSPK